MVGGQLRQQHNRRDFIKKGFGLIGGIAAAFHSVKKAKPVKEAPKGTKEFRYWADYDGTACFSGAYPVCETDGHYEMGRYMPERKIMVWYPVEKCEIHNIWVQV